MEFAAFVALRLPTTILRLASAELSEVLSSLWDHILVQLHLDPAQLLSCVLMSVVHGRKNGPHCPEPRQNRPSRKRGGMRGRYAM
jgi:hypothetical protein